MRARYYNIIFLWITLLTAANNVSANGLRERVYLHTDKQLYLAGELLWMKMYVMDADGRPLPFSKVGYVELLEGATAQVQVKLDIQHATGEGWIEIPATLPTGYYQLVGYTRNMQNEGESVYFHKTIGIINTFRTDATLQLDHTINAPEQSLLDNTVSVITERHTYSPRSQSNIQINGLPENVHSLSLSVSGKDLITAENMNISQWHGYLSSLPNKSFEAALTPEYEGHIIRANVKDIETNEVVPEKIVYPVAGYIGDQIRLFGGQLSNDGSIEFYTNRVRGVHELATTCFVPSENKYRIDVESPFANHSEVKVPVFKMNPTWEEELTQRSVGLQVLHTFFVDSMSRIDTTYAYFQWKPDRSYILDEYTRFTRMDEIVIEFIPSLRFRRMGEKRVLSVLEEDNNAFTYGNSLVMLDGIPISDHELIYKYDPLLIYKIDVYKSKFVFGGQFYNGMVFISTYNKDYPTLVFDSHTQIFDYEGTQAHRWFYAPSYTDETRKDTHIPDYRHTLLWYPELQTAGQTSLTVPFSTSDLTGEFQVTVEGITKDGQPVRGVARFNVE